jgi:hypothetical protein
VRQDKEFPLAHLGAAFFRDYHRSLDEQGDELFATTDAIAERVRKIGGTTLRSIAHISRLQRIRNNDPEHVPTIDMLAELGAITSSSWSGCVRRTTCATNTATSRARACSRIGLMRPSPGFGSCLKQRAPTVGDGQRLKSGSRWAGAGAPPLAKTPVEKPAPYNISHLFCWPGPSSPA